MNLKMSTDINQTTVKITRERESPFNTQVPDSKACTFHYVFRKLFQKIRKAFHNSIALNTRNLPDTKIHLKERKKENPNSQFSTNQSP